MENQMELPKLDDYLWLSILEYLDLRSQFVLASVNNYFGTLLKYLPKFKHIDAEIINMFNDNELHQLFDKVGSIVISYSGPMESEYDSEQHVWLLRTYCPKLSKLKLRIKRDICKTLADLNNIEELYLNLHLKSLSTNEVNFLKNLPKLKKLTIEKTQGAFARGGTNLCWLECLESLDVSLYEEFNSEDVEECCTSMNQLRHLNLGLCDKKLKDRHFKIMKRNCKELERLGFGMYNKETVKYESVCRLPKLQHLCVWTIPFSIPTEFLNALIVKVNKPHPPLSLILNLSVQLPEHDIELISQIITLNELKVFCDVAHIKHLSNLCNLKYLHIITQGITDIDLLNLIKSLPKLTILSVCSEVLFTETFYSSVQQWLSQDGQDRSSRIEIYVQFPEGQLKNTNLIKIIKGNSDPILFNSYLK